MSETDSLIGASLGQYKIVELLGKGGMATVYKAVQASINRTVAIKVLPPSFLHDDTFMQRFRREAEVIAKLEHFHILPIYDYGEYKGMPFIVMRYLEGGTLQDRIRQGPLPWNDIVRIISQVAEALDYAHSRNVIHRDIKPSNIMLDAQGNAYLADFGIAKIQEGTSQLTGSGIVGTPAYMAPEQSEPGPPAPSMDIYALGVTLFEMITGHVPYEADTPIVQILMHIQQPVPSLPGYNPDIPLEVDRVVQRAMAKSPSERYQSAGELAQALVTATSASGGWSWAPETLARLPQKSPTMPAVSRKPPETRPQPARPKGAVSLAWLGIGVIGLVAVGVAVGLFLLLGRPQDLAEATTEAPTAQEMAALPTDTPSPTSTATETLFSPTPDLSTPTSSPEPSATLEPTALPPSITLRGINMLLVPAGPFVMGNNRGYPNERPEHEVYLDAFYIDETEVTNLYYRTCVREGACNPPEFVDSPSRIGYYTNEFYNNYPVIYINWNDAQAYCQWRGGHLPTEAQWEKAARWDPATNESRLFPWGPTAADLYYTNFGYLLGDTAPVANYPAGRSPIGIYDMAGNVAEWVYDWYQDDFYEQSPYENPIGPPSGRFKVYRGGGYGATGSALTGSFRQYTSPATEDAQIGFRCAYTPSGDPTGGQ